MPPVLPDELAQLITSFAGVDGGQRSKAYLTLSAFCQGVRSSSFVDGKPTDSKADTETLVHIFSPIVIPRLQGTDENGLLVGMSFLTAVFQVDRDSASAIFTAGGILELIMDIVELNPSPELSLCVAHLLSQACGDKHCRSILTPDVPKWLQYSAQQTKEPALRGAATVALIKYSKGSVSDRADSIDAASLSELPENDHDLAETMKQLIVSDQQSSVHDAVEGLAYLSADPRVKEGIANDEAFLKKLFALVPRSKSQTLDSTLVFGILLIVSNLCTYRPQLTEEQQNIEKLRRMAMATGTPGPSTLDDDNNVKERVRKAVSAGVLDIFAPASRVDSDGVRKHVGKALLGIVTDPAHRGKVLQSGGTKTLMLVIKHGLHSKDGQQLDPVYLDPIQALAKLTITSSPVQVFGPNDGALFDAIRPLSLMLQHPNAGLLPCFESLMALTNIASHSPAAATKVAEAKGLMNKVELLLLEDHPLMRRAAMELICNLIGGSDAVFEKYGAGESSNATKAKLQLILAMTDVDDLPTRLAASGALATLTSAPNTCQTLLTLQKERHRVLPILTQLIDPSTDPGQAGTEADPGLVHRGLVCVLNLFQSPHATGDLRIEAEKSGLIAAIKKSASDEQLSGAIKTVAAEAALAAL